MSEPIRVLFLCTANSARSQIAQALLQQMGGGGFFVESAGSEPTSVNRYTVRVLAESGIDWSGAASKSLDAFVGERWDYVITVCDRARQACPVFPGRPDTLHWGLDDPAEAEGTDDERLAAFRRTRWSSPSACVPSWLSPDGLPPIRPSDPRPRARGTVAKRVSTGLTPRSAISRTTQRDGGGPA